MKRSLAIMGAKPIS